MSAERKGWEDILFLINRRLEAGFTHSDELIGGYQHTDLLTVSKANVMMLISFMPTDLLGKSLL